MAQAELLVTAEAGAPSASNAQTSVPHTCRYNIDIPIQDSCAHVCLAAVCVVVPCQGPKVLCAAVVYSDDRAIRCAQASINDACCMQLH